MNGNLGKQMKLFNGSNRGFYHVFYRADHAYLTFRAVFHPIGSTTDLECEHPVDLTKILDFAALVLPRLSK